MSYFSPNQPLKKGKYQIIRTLGGGGFGVTYLAQDHKYNRPVVIKTLNYLVFCQRYGNKPNFDEIWNDLQEDFVREAITLATFDHPHIVKIYPQMFQEDGLWCMVMEYVEGQHLIEVIEEKGVFSETEALQLIQKIGNAVSYIHSKNYLHRDIKPHNILLRKEDNEPILIDFGLAREVDFAESMTLTNSQTPTFAPPEQFEKRARFTPALDVYSLAATLYVLVAVNDPPFIPLTSPYLNAKIMLDMNMAHKPPFDLNPHLSQRVNEGILQGMALDVSQRPQSVQEWLDLLMPPCNPVFSFEIVTVNRRGEITHRERKEAEYYTEMLPGGVALEMVAIPGGTFFIGTDEEEIARLTKKSNQDVFKMESPQHSVTVSPFYMGKYPITQVQWQAVASLPKIERDLKPDPSYFKGDNRPVESVSWYDAVEFCARLSKATGKGYRLPSESQWEYACRAIPSPPTPLPQGEGRIYPPFYFGETLTDQLANYDASYTYADEKPGKYREQTTPVGSFPPNAFGLYDMHGNVLEWCLDPWHDDYEGAPDNGEVWQENGNDNRSPLRGSSWLDGPYNCRSAFRFNYFNGRDRYNYIIGFRVLCVAPRTF